MSIRSIASLILRVRLVVLAGVCVATGAIEGMHLAPLHDHLLFVDAGRAMLSSAWPSTFADSALQAGPLQVLLSGVGALLGDAAGTRPWVPYAVASQLLTLGLLVHALRTLRTRGGGELAELVAGLVVIVGIAAPAWVAGHPAQTFVPLLWIAAGGHARGGRPGLGGLAVAAAALFEPWGALGAPVLLLCPDVRRALRSAVAAAVVTVLAYLPFLVLGAVATFDYAWSVEGHSVLARWLGPSTEFTWPMRVVQGTVVIAAGAAAAGVARRTLGPVWVVPLLVAGVRMGTDPTAYFYYALSLQTIVMVGAASLEGLRSAPTRRRAVLSLAAIGLATASGSPELLAVTACVGAFANARAGGARAPAPQPGRRQGLKEPFALAD